MQRHALLRGPASTVLGAMQRASTEVQNRGEHAQSGSGRRRRNDGPAASHHRAHAFVMPCFAELAAAAQRQTGSSSGSQHSGTHSDASRDDHTASGTSEARVMVPQLRAAVARCFNESSKRFSHGAGTADVAVPSTQSNPVPATSHSDTRSGDAAHVPDADDSASPGASAQLACLMDALEGYSPTLHPRFIQRVAERVGMPSALVQAQKLIDLAQAQYDAAAPDADLHAFRDLLRRWRAERQRASPQTLGKAAEQLCVEEEEAGILTRLHLGQGTRRQRLEGALVDAGDVQVNEVLPDGHVVTFTHATLPEDETSVEGKGKHRHNLVASLEALFAPSPAAPAPRRAVYLHFILYKNAVPLAEALRFLSRVVGEEVVTPSDFSVHQVLDDKAATVQTCVAKVVVPTEVLAAEDGSAVDWCRHVARRLAEINVTAARGDHADGSSAPVAIQLLDWLPSCPITETGSGAGAQYTFLVRGVCPPRGSPPHYVETVLRHTLAAIPNFFAPSHFGPLGVACPFKTYHISSALAHGRWAEGMMMAVALILWQTDAPRASSPAWVRTVFTALAEGEERPAVLRALWCEAVPPSVRAHFAHASTELVWNTLASCRLQTWKEGKTGVGAGILNADVAVAGDFVMTLPDHSELVQVPPQKTEMVLLVPALADSSSRQSTAGHASSALSVQPLFTTPAGVAPPMSAVAIPLLSREMLPHACPAVHTLGVALGLFPATAAVASSSAQDSLDEIAVPRFRPLLLQASGYPQAERPWIKAFPEPIQANAATTATTATPRYRLATDLALASRHHTDDGASTRDFASASRGSQARVWPLGRRGRSMVARLPAGLLAATSLATPPRHVARHRGRAQEKPRASPFASSSSSSSSSSSWCVALNVTLPAAAYAGGFLRECLVLADYRPDSTHAATPSPLDALMAELRGRPSEEGRDARAASASTPPVVSTARDDEDDGDSEEVEGNLLTPRRRR